MLARALRSAAVYATDATAGGSRPDYATLGPNAPIAWPSNAKKVPVTGQLSPHAAAHLERMGITVPKKE